MRRPTRRSCSAIRPPTSTTTLATASSPRSQAARLSGPAARARLALRLAGGSGLRSRSSRGSPHATPGRCRARPPRRPSGMPADRGAQLQVEQIGERERLGGEATCRRHEGHQTRPGSGKGLSPERLLRARVVRQGGGDSDADDRELLAVEADLVSNVDAERVCVACFHDRLTAPVDPMPLGDKRLIDRCACLVASLNRHAGGRRARGLASPRRPDMGLSERSTPAAWANASNPRCPFLGGLAVGAGQCLVCGS